MAKNSKAKKATSAGKGKVTPVQIAFIVDRFLADNNYTNTLAAFRFEAADLFSKTKGKEVPKGLLGLGDILDEYISLKEQRVMVDQEKRRVEVAFQGLQDVMRAYHSPQSPPLLSPQIGMNPSSGSPPQDVGHMIHGSFVNYAQLPLLPPRFEETNKFSTPIPNSSSGEKRKASSSAPRVPPPPKKQREGSTKDPHMIEDTMSYENIRGANNTQINIAKTSVVKSASTGSTVQSPVQGSSIAKSLFRNPPEIRASSSPPMTPPRALQCQNDKTSIPVENSSLNVSGASSSQKIVPSSCAIISSERIIISPLKHKGYYSVERSYRVSASPLKSSPENLNKREHVKGRLDFDDCCASESSEEPVAIESSPSTTDGEAAGSFDFDLPDFDFFDEDFSNLLGDIDLECEQVHFCEQSSTHADLLPGLEQNMGNRFLELDQALPNPCLSTATEIISQKDMNVQGLDTITTMRSITKRVMVSSPSKCSSSGSLQQTDSPAKP